MLCLSPPHPHNRDLVPLNSPPWPSEHNALRFGQRIARQRTYFHGATFDSANAIAHDSLGLSDVHHRRQHHAANGAYHDVLVVTAYLEEAITRVAESTRVAVFASANERCCP